MCPIFPQARGLQCWFRGVYSACSLFPRSRRVSPGLVVLGLVVLVRLARKLNPRGFYDSYRVDEQGDSSIDDSDAAFGVYQYTQAFRVLQRVRKERASGAGKIGGRESHSTVRLAKQGRICSQRSGKSGSSRRSGRVNPCSRGVLANCEILSRFPYCQLGSFANLDGIVAGLQRDLGAASGSVLSFQM